MSADVMSNLGSCIDLFTCYWTGSWLINTRVTTHRQQAG